MEHPEQPVDTDYSAAISVAVQHPAVSSDPKIVCNLSRVCKALRTAVQQSNAGQTAIEFSLRPNFVPVPKLMALATWLPRHSGLVSSFRTTWARTSTAAMNDASSLCLDLVRGLTTLTQLTQLSLDCGACNIPNSDVKLPAQLQVLTVTFGVPDIDLYIDLQYLTNLRQLKVDFHKQPITSVALPAHLKRLNVGTNGRRSVLEVCDVASLHWLTELQLRFSQDSVEQLQSLAGHPQLQRLKLVGPDVKQVVATSVWQHIPQLNNLSFTSHQIVGHSAILERFVQSISAATGLTQLDLGMVVRLHGGNDDNVSDLTYQHLTNLTAIRDLATWSQTRQQSVGQGIQHLSALTALTKLDLGTGMFGPSSEHVVLQLASALTNLEWLHMSDEWSNAPLVAIGHLSRLQNLRIPMSEHDMYSDSGLGAKASLSCLTGLGRLTALGGFDKSGKAPLDAFWATIKAKQQ